MIPLADLDRPQQSADPWHVRLLAGLRARPLVVLAICLVLGVVWADHFAPEPLPVALLAGLALVMVLLGITLRMPATGLLLCIAAALIGASMHAHRVRPTADDVVHLAETGPVSLVATVTRLVSSSEFHQRVQLDVHGAARGDAAVPGGGSLLCALPPDQSVDLGQTVLLRDVVIWPPRRITSPGQYDEKRTLARRGVHALGRAGSVEVVRPQPLWRSALETSVARLRAHVVQVMRAAMPGPQSELLADLLAGMVFGMYNVELPPDLVEHFRRSGTIHVMVVSGAHVTLVATAIIFLVQGISVRLPLWVLLVAAPPLLLYALMAGLYPSVLRSLAMAALLLLSMVSGRRYDFWTALSMAAIALVIADSAAPFSIGVQLTFAAVIGVVAFLPRGLLRHDDEPSPVRRYVLALVGASLGAWLAVTPIVAHHFDMLVLGGILANLIVVPIRAVVMGIGFAVVLLGSVWVPLAVLPCAVGRALLAVMVWVVQGFSSLPGSAVSGFHLPPAAIVVWYLGAVVVWWLLYGCTTRGSAGTHTETATRHDRHPAQPSAARGWMAASLFTLGAAVFLAAAVTTRPPQQLRVTFLAVGQGHCAVISDTGDNHIMIDAGSALASPRAYQWVGPRVILPHLARMRIRSLDALIMTHAHADHCNAMADIIEAMPVRTLATNGLSLDGYPDALEAQAVARRRGVQPVVLRAGSRISLADGAELAIVHPPAVPLRHTAEDCNNNSIVARLTYGQVSFLFPADLEAEGERALLRWARTHGTTLRSDVLLLPHHGRNTSSTAELLDAVSPSLAVVSGAIPRWEPAHPQVLRRLDTRGIPLLSTDLLGSIEIRTDGRRLWISSYDGNYPEDRRQRRWQATTSARNCSASGCAARSRPRREVIAPANRSANSARTCPSNSSRRARNREAASASCSVSMRMRLRNSSLADVASAGIALCPSRRLGSTGMSAARSLTTTVPAA